MPHWTVPHSRPWICDADVAAVIAQLRSNQIAEGEVASRLEVELASRYGFRHAIVAGSGSQALKLALAACGVSSRSTVTLPTYVCPEVLGVVEAIGAKAAVADVGRDYLLDVEDGMLDGSDAVVVPAILGICADARRFMRVNRVVIADWAQYAPLQPGEPQDAYDVAIVSFEATKLLASGEGGAVLVRHDELAERVRAEKRIGDTGLKLNLFPLSDLQSALAMSQLKRLDDFLARRRQIAERLAKAAPDAVHVPSASRFRFAIQVEDARATAARFAERGVAARLPVTPLVHHVRSQRRDFPVANKLYRQTLSLPCHPSLTEEELSRVERALVEVLGR